MQLHMLKLEKNFWLKEFIRSNVASRKGIVNWPPNNIEENDVIDRLRKLCEKILQPVRDSYNLPITIHSGYRCPQLNTFVGSKPFSHHVFGFAADWEMIGVSNLEIAKYIEYHLDFDELILEYYVSGDPNSGWIHTSYRGDDNRGRVLTINEKGIFPGIKE